MKTCPKCKFQNSDDARFCEKCGAKFVPNRTRKVISPKPLSEIQTDKQTVLLPANSNLKKIIGVLISLCIIIAVSFIALLTNYYDQKHSKIFYLNQISALNQSGHIVQPDGFEMIFVSTHGTFLHTGAESNFYIGKYEVTQALWQSIMGNNPSVIKGHNKPVTNVSYYDIQQFLEKLNNQTGRNYRLPSVDEWLFAQKEGLRFSNKLYSGSDNLNEVAWYYGNSSYTIHPVGSKHPNLLGIYDMTGNVAECCDNTQETKDCCYCGGSANSVNFDVWSLSKQDKDKYLGFRIAISFSTANSME